MTMVKPFLYRLFKVGKIPAQELSRLHTEGIVWLEEGVQGSVTYRDFRAPGRSDSWRQQWFPASIILTNQRLLILRYTNPIIDVSLEDERLKNMRFSIVNDSSLCVVSDASLFRDDWSGTIEYCFRTSEPGRLLELLQRQIVE